MPEVASCGGPQQLDSRGGVVGVPTLPAYFVKSCDGLFDKMKWFPAPDPRPGIVK